MNTMNGYAKNILSDNYVLSAAGGHIPLSNFFTARKISEYTVDIDEANNWYYLGTFSSQQGYSPLHIHVSGIDANMNNTCTVMMSNLSGWSWSKLILCGTSTNTTSLTTLGFYLSGNTGVKVYAYIKNTKTTSYAYTGYKVKITYNPSTFTAASEVTKATSSEINSTVLLEYGNNTVYSNLTGDTKSQNVKLCAYNTNSEYGKLFINKLGTACTTSGTAGTVGETYLVLGNSTAVSSTLNQGAHNARGILRLYGTSSGYTNILCGTNNTAAYLLYLPGANGLLVYHTNDTAAGSYILPAYVTSAGEAKAVTSVGEAFLSWGGKAIDGDVSLIDASVESSLANNRLSFIDPRCVKVEYSTDGGTNWLDYGATDANKINLVTSGLSSSFDIGNKSTALTNQDMLRITISSSFTENGVTTNSVYFYMRKLLIYLTTEGAKDCRCTVETSKNSDPTTFTKLTGGHILDDDKNYTIYRVKGWSGWNSIPINGNFGSYSLSNNYHSVRLTFSFLSNLDSYIDTTRFRVHKVYLLGTTVWTNNTGVPLMQTGHMYTWDSNKNIYPKTNNSLLLGTSNNKWKGVYATTFYGNLTGTASHVSCTATSDNTTRPIVLTNTNNQLYYTTKATINYSTGTITAPTFNGTATTVVCNAASSDNNRPIVGTNTSNLLYYTTKATINWSTGNITAPTFTGNLEGNINPFTTISYTSGTTTVADIKDALVTAFTNVDKGIGANVVVPTKAIANWSTDTTVITDSSVYSMIKIGGGYKGTTYGQWLLSSYNTSKIGYVGRSDSTWSRIYWLANTENLSNVAYGTCSTAAGTAAKIIALSSTSTWELKTGSIVVVKFTYTNTANNPTFNVADTGAKSVWYNTAVITTSNKDKAGTANRPSIYMYDGTNFVFLGWSYDTNSTYANYSLGQGYGTCTTAEATTEKAVTLSNYNLSTGGIVSVRFTYGVPASATMNINSKGAKAIYYRNSSIVANIIHAGDTATFIYDGTYYHLISIDKGNASLSTYGYMSASDKLKLDAIAENADNVSISRNLTSGTKIGTITINGTGTDLYCLTNTTYSLSGALNGNTFVSTLTPSSGSNTTSTVPAMTAATSSAAGKAGLVPAPAANKHTSFLRGDGTWVIPTNTTYTFENGTNGFTVTPSGGTALTVTVTPSITNNVTGSGTSGYLAKFNGTNTITNGPQLGTGTTTFLRNDGTWATPVDTKVTIAAITATATANYYFPMHTSTSGTTTLVATPLIHLESLKGTTTLLGYTVLWVGSKAATGTTDNAYGILRLCAKNTYYTGLEAGSNTSNVSLKLPTTSGTLALTSLLNKVTSTPVTTGTVYLTGTTNSAGETAGLSFYTTFYVNASGVYWTSDRRFKKNIHSPVKSGLLEDETGFIRKFDWKETGKASYGFIAQELLQLIPEAVDYDEELNKYSVNYNVAHSAAIAQLVIKIKELESEIKYLKLLIN